MENFAFDFMEMFTREGFLVLLQVIAIDLVLAGDNAVVIGLAAAGLPLHQRGKAILIGIIAATILRIGFASITVHLLSIVGIILFGGVLLLWVCWKMYGELRNHKANAEEMQHALDDASKAPPKNKSFAQAAWQIVIADVSMSLDNVLAVAGAARDHPSILIVGLVLSIAMMGLAASMIARILDRYHWIAWLGWLVIVYVAGDMIYRGTVEVLPYVQSWLAG